jgi:GTP-binding protein
VPAGTLVHDCESGDFIADLDRHGAEVTVARGGRGGRGNAAFATSVNRAPRRAEEGRPGEVRRIRLTLKLLADAGLIGLPNVGKSTLISRISSAKPKIADYPFTTLTPNLGTVRAGEERSFVVADVPGLIPGAHQGKGLGSRFLRHVERCKVLVHLVTLAEEGDDPLRDFDALEAELRLHDPELAQRPRLAGLTKLDLPWVADAAEALVADFGERGIELCPFSAVSGQGLDRLVGRIARLLWGRF